MEQFIEAVRRYPCLWNTTASEYRDQELKDAAWAEVMKDTELSSVKEVKLKWKKLRDSYRDALKRQSDMLAKEPGVGAGKKNYAWKYMGLMQFLQPYMIVRKKPAESPGHTATRDGAAECAAEGAAESVAHNGDARSSSSSCSSAGSPARRASRAPRDPRAERHSRRLAAIDRKLEYLCRAAAGARCSAEPARRDRKRDPPSAPPDPLDIFFNGMCQTTKRLPYQTQVKVKRMLFDAVTEAEEALIAEQQSYASLWARGAGSSSSSEADDAPDAAPESRRAP